MNDLRVLLVSPVGELGGGEKVFLSLIECLRDWKVEPMLACMRPGPLATRVRQQGVDVYEFKEHRYRQLPTVWEGIQWLTKIIRETNVDLVHANHTGHAYSSPASRLANVPEIWHLHDYPYRPDWVDRLLTLLPTDHIIFTTNKVKSGYPKFHHLPNSIIPPCCIDPNYLQSISCQKNIRKKYQLPQGSLFLTVARLQEHKGHRYLIDAVPTVLQRYPNVTFAIIGKPSDQEQKDYQQALIQQAEELGIQQQVRFLGFVDDVDLISLYHETTALVHPAISEGFGLVLLESMFLKVPVIAAAADGPSELIQDHQNGLLVATRDSESLARALIELLEKPNLATTLSHNGNAFVQSFVPSLMLEKTVNVYHSLIKE